MRILDIGVAAGYALLCLGVISAMSPYASSSAAAQQLSQERADAAVAHYVDSVGLVFLANSPAAVVCQSLREASNSTVVLGGTIGGLTCPGAPDASLAESTLSFAAAGRSEVIDAWVEGQ